MIRKVFNSVFTLKKIVHALILGTLVFAFRSFIVSFLSLDTSVYVEFLMSFCPSVLLSRLAVGLVESYLGQDTMGMSPYSGNKINLFTNGCDSSSGSGSGTGSSSGPGANPNNSASETLKKAKENFELEKTRKLELKRKETLALELGKIEADDHFRDSNRKMQNAHIAETQPFTQVKSDIQQQEMIRDHLNSLDVNYNAKHRSLNEFVNRSPNPGDVVNVNDPAGISARGFNPNGINQPFATSLANSPEIQRVCGKTVYPTNLDDNARRFLMDFLRHNKPEVYGRFPTKDFNCLITREVVNLLKRSN